MPRRCARSRTSVSVFSMAVGRSNSVRSSSIRPASILDRSRISLMRESRCRPDSVMSARYSACLSFISPNIRSDRTSEKPMMALSGVRSSCDMLARNSLLCWLAISSCRLLTSISRKRRAFWIASADCDAKVLSSVDRPPARIPRRSSGSRPDRRAGGPRAATAPPATTGSPGRMSFSRTRLW